MCVTYTLEYVATLTFCQLIILTLYALGERISSVKPKKFDFDFKIRRDH